MTVCVQMGEVHLVAVIQPGSTFTAPSNHLSGLILSFLFGAGNESSLYLLCSGCILRPQ
jgi:hypothetical protein